jgi:GMP synthase (glutamine-hydrolysing)
MPAEEDRTILILKTGEPVPWVREHRGQFADLIRETIGAEWDGGYRVVDAVAETPPLPADVWAVVITGSAASVPDRLPWMIHTEHWLGEVLWTGTPIFGICFGHQLLAKLLGGEVQRNPRGREIGTRTLERLRPSALPPPDPASIFAGIPDRFEAQVTHVDSVVRLPRGAEALARSDLEDHHAIRFTETCYGVQFHPEMDAEVMRAYVEARRDVLHAEGFQVDEMLAEIRETEAARQPLLNFVRWVASGAHPRRR